MPPKLASRKAKAKAKAKAKTKTKAKAKAKGKAAVAKSKGKSGSAAKAGSRPSTGAQTLRKPAARPQEARSSPVATKRPASAEPSPEVPATASGAYVREPLFEASSPPAGPVGKSRFIVRPPSAPAAASSSRAGSPAATVLPYTVALMLFNDHGGGTLQYKSLGTFPTTESANARVAREMTKWRHEDARPACEEAVRHLDGDERAAKLTALVQTSIVVGKRRAELGLTSAVASIKGLDIGGSSNHWCWQSMSSSSDLADEARKFCLEIRGPDATGKPPEPYPLV